MTIFTGSSMRCVARRALMCASVLVTCHSAMAQTSTESDWRTIDPANTLYMELDAGRVIIELAPKLAPNHVENIKALVREKYFDSQRITRAQDNFVVQWGDPMVAKSLVNAKRTLPAEFTRSAVGLPFDAHPDGDVYAPQVGFSEGFPAARESESGAAWGVHCYGTLGVGRDNEANSGGGTELYVVIGHAPRQLDRNVTVVGRVVRGMPLLSTLPRGAGGSGFYEKRSEHTLIRSIRLASDLPENEREPLEALRTDSKRFAEQTEARRNRKDEWYKVPSGHLDVCNVPLPARRKRD